jgi:hypothetical protein
MVIFMKNPPKDTSAMPKVKNLQEKGIKRNKDT